MASRIPTEFIEELLARTDIVEIIGSRITLKKGGQNFTGLCPFHQEKTASFSVSQDKQFYYCFGCQATGSALKFIMEHDHLDFIPAVEMLAAKVGMQIPREEDPQYDEKRRKQKSLYEILEKSNQFYKHQLRHHEDKDLAVRYLKDRGIGGPIARDFAIGYAPKGWDNLLRKLAITNADRALLIDSGMLIEREEEKKTYDRFRDRIMFPIRDLRGRVIGFGGRIIDSGKPKYLNSPETRVFHKGRELYGLYEARRATQKLTRILVTEGYMDVVMLAQHGITFAVATLGTATSNEHIGLIFRLVPEVIFCFDGDEAGRSAAWKALNEALPAMSDGRSARFLFLPDGEDPDSLVRKEGQQGFMARFDDSQHLPEFFFDSLSAEVDMSSLEGKAKLSKLAMPMIDRIPEGVLKQLMVNRLAALTGLDTDRLLRVASHDASRPGRPSGNGYNRRSTQPRQHAQLSIAQLAIALLLRQPELVDQLTDAEYALLDELQDTDGRLLKDMIRLLRANVGMTPQKLLDYFNNDAEFGRLSRLSRLEHLLPVDQLASEYQGAIRKLSQRSKQQSFQPLRKKIKDRPLSELSEEDKQAIRSMLHSRREDGTE
jgi:DNA primase